MKVKFILRQIYLTLVAIGFMAVCTLPSDEPMPTPTQPVVTPQPLANVNCNELSFYLDPALGRGFECVTLPESSSSDIPMNIFTYPEHTELTIQNYPRSKTQFSPQVIVYPVDWFAELLPEVVPQRVSDLEAYISSGIWNGGELPFLPPLPLLQTFYSHDTRISFINGQGVRYITEYNESSSVPVSNRTIFYTFQGLTYDGKYWVTVTLPISHPVLPENADFSTLPHGYTFEIWFQNYDAFIGNILSTLEPQKPDSFYPAINSMDNLVTSITIRQ